MLKKWLEQRKAQWKIYKRRLKEEWIVMRKNVHRHFFKYHPRTAYELGLVFKEFVWISLILSILFLPFFYFDPNSVSRLLLSFIALLIIAYFLSKQGSWMYWNGQLGHATVTKLEDRTNKRTGIKMREGLIHYSFLDHKGQLHNGKRHLKMFAKKFPVVGGIYPIIYDPGEPSDHQVHFAGKAESIARKYADIQEIKLSRVSD